MATLQSRLSSVIQAIGADIKNIYVTINVLSQTISNIQGGSISEYDNVNAQSPISDKLYLNRKIVNNGEVRMYIMGMPIFTQKNEFFIEANTSDGLKQIGLK